MFPCIPGRAGYDKRLRRSRRFLHNVMAHPPGTAARRGGLWLADSTLALPADAAAIPSNPPIRALLSYAASVARACALVSCL